MYADESCDEHVVYFSAMIEMTCHVLITFLISDNDVISLESRPLNFRVIILAYSRHISVVAKMHTKSIQKQIFEYDIKSEYPEQYSTVDKVGGEKP